MRSLRQRTVTRATFLIEPVERRFLLASFVVTTTADSGPGSLREAITLSNTTPGFDDILFAIPGTGVQTIALEAPLPAITDSVTIDATTQPGWSGSPVVVIDGSNAGPHADGLVIASSDPIAASNVLALGVQNFHGNGVVITGNGNLVALMEISGNKGNGVLIELSEKHD